MKRASLLLAALLAATSCGFGPSSYVVPEAGDISVEANTDALAQIASDLLGAPAAGSQAQARLVLDEHTSSNVVVRDVDGRANTVKLSYVLAYRLESEDGSELYGNSFRYSQNLAHDDAALRASLLSRERIFEQSRRRGVIQAMRETAAVLYGSNGE